MEPGAKRAFPHPPPFGPDCCRPFSRDVAPLPAPRGAAGTSGRARLPVGPGQAVETRGRDANGRADLLPLDCGPSVHLRHVSQVPRTEANSAPDKRFSAAGPPSGSAALPAAGPAGAVPPGAARFRCGPGKPRRVSRWLAAEQAAQPKGGPAPPHPASPALNSQGSWGPHQPPGLPRGHLRTPAALTRTLSPRLL